MELWVKVRPSGGSARDVVVPPGGWRGVGGERGGGRVEGQGEGEGHST